jgi:hypothetical protein
MPDNKDLAKDAEEVFGDWKEKKLTYGDSWDFKTNKSLIGVFKGTHQAVTKYGEKTVYDMEDDKGKSVSIWESAQIKRGFDGVEIGTEMRIVYQGKGQSKNGQPVNEFKFFFK